MRKPMDMKAKVPEHVPADLVRELNRFTPDGSESCPYARVAQLSDGPRVLYNVRDDAYSGGDWVLTRADDIRAAFQQPEVFSSSGMSGFSKMLGASWPLIPLELDPPEHSKYRPLLNSFFSPKAIGPMEGEVRRRADALIDRVAAQGSCEFVEAFGRPFPVSIFMQLMGLPDDDMEVLNGWEHDLLHARNMEARLRGVRGFYGYLTELREKRRAKPQDDLATYVVKAEVDGRPLNDDEIIGIYFLLVVAGLDTVASSLGLHFRHLALNPEDQARLRAEPELIPAAVEELLRRYGTISSYRVVARDTEVAGVEMKAGDRLNLLTYLGSLDPTEFNDPLKVDFDRSPNRHMAFAYGPHRCVGSHLARRELTIALEQWLKRVPPFRIQEGATAPVEPGEVLGVSALPLVWT